MFDKKYKVDKSAVCCMNCVHFSRHDYWEDIPNGLCKKWGGWAGAGDARYTRCSFDGDNAGFENKYGYDEYGELLTLGPHYRKLILYFVVVLGIIVGLLI